MIDSQPAAGAFHPSTRFYRFTMLFFVSMLPFGSYFAYDSIGAIENILMKALNMRPSTIASLYSAYSIAAIVIVFFSGILIDKLGTRKGSMIFTSLVALGAMIVALADSTWMLFVGRMIFGAGSESLLVAQMAIMSKWFRGKELALAFGISLTISRLGTLFSFNTEALIAQHFGNYKYALWAAFLLCLVSVLCNLVSNLMDRRGERILDQRDEGGGDRIVLADIKAFRPSYWYVTLLCLTFYSAIFPFTALSTHMFHEKWGIPDVQAGSGGLLYGVFFNILHMFTTAPGITSIVILASMVFAPFAGHLVDRIGRRGTLMVFGALLMIPAHALLGLTQVNPVLPMIMLGAAFVLVPAAMWPAIPLLVPKDKLGTAFGLTNMIQNGGLFLFPILNGRLRDLTHSYTASQLMFASLGVVALVFAWLLLRSDKRSGGALERADHH